jgi:hypothetical protein
MTSMNNSNGEFAFEDTCGIDCNTTTNQSANSNSYGASAGSQNCQHAIECAHVPKTEQKTTPTPTLDKLSCTKCVCNQRRTAAHVAVSAAEAAEFVVEECPVACPAGCGVKVLPSDGEEHSIVCSSKVVKCTALSGCKWTGPRRFLLQHSATCPCLHVSPVLNVLLNRVDNLSNDLAVAHGAVKDLNEQCEFMRQLLRQHEQTIRELQAQPSQPENTQ